MLRSDLCDYSNAYIIAKDRIKDIMLGPLQIMI